MKNDPRTIYPGTNYYGSMTSPLDAGMGMGMGLARPTPQMTGLTRPPFAGGLSAPPLSSVFSESMKPPGPGSTGVIR